MVMTSFKHTHTHIVPRPWYLFHGTHWICSIERCIRRDTTIAFHLFVALESAACQLLKPGHSRIKEKEYSLAFFNQKLFHVFVSSVHWNSPARVSLKKQPLPQLRRESSWCKLVPYTFVPGYQLLRQSEKLCLHLRLKRWGSLTM